MDPDAELHAAIIVGEEDAVAEFEQRYGKQFIGRAVRHGLPLADAEDAWQDVFIKSIERARTLTGPLGLSLRQYASRAMGNRIADFHRSHRDEVGLDELAQADPPSPTPAEERIRVAVRRCLEGLPDGHRAILEALISEQVPPDTLAETLGIPRNTIYQKRIRAIARIRPCLEEALYGN